MNFILRVMGTSSRTSDWVRFAHQTQLSLPTSCTSGRHERCCGSQPDRICDSDVCGNNGERAVRGDFQLMTTWIWGGAWGCAGGALPVLAPQSLALGEASFRVVRAALQRVSRAKEPKLSGNSGVNELGSRLFSPPNGRSPSGQPDGNLRTALLARTPSLQAGQLPDS